MATYKRDIFRKTYFTGLVELDRDIPCEPSDLEIRRIKEEDEMKMIDKISNIETTMGSCYYRLLIAAVQKHKSYRETSRQTGVPVMSIVDAMKKIRKVLTND